MLAYDYDTIRWFPVKTSSDQNGPALVKTALGL